jgi:hypothetical protein
MKKGADKKKRKKEEQKKKVTWKYLVTKAGGGVAKQRRVLPPGGLLPYTFCIYLSLFFFFCLPFILLFYIQTTLGQIHRSIFFQSFSVEE